MKIEEVKQQPVERRWKFTPPRSCVDVTLTEPEAREIFQYFAPIFGGSHNGEWCYYATLVTKQVAALSEKDAEIARLKEQKKYNADKVVRLSNENEKLKQDLSLADAAVNGYLVHGRLDEPAE